MGATVMGAAADGRIGANLIGELREQAEKVRNHIKDDNGDEEVRLKAKLHLDLRESMEEAGGRNEFSLRDLVDYSYEYLMNTLG